MSQHDQDPPSAGFSQGHYQPVMGTDLRVQVWAGDRAAAEHAERVLVERIGELSAVFTTWQDDSLLVRWRRGEVDAPPGSELEQVLASAADWFVRGRGSFHPACEALRRRWLEAEATGVVPSREELQDLADGLRDLPWRAEDGHPGAERIVRTGDCSGADLNAFVKGWILDDAIRAARQRVPGTTRIGVNAGGDLRHVGWGSWRVGVEDPLRPSDNGADRLCTIAVANQAVATSGLARRGFRVGDRWFGHVVDPRTGWPVDHVAQVSVAAPDAATADVLATICGVLPLDEGIALVEQQAGAEALVVGARGEQVTTPGWEALLA